jgi:hypothetical protein
MFLAIKNGKVYCHKTLEGLKQYGITKADKEVQDTEFEAAGGIARVVSGKIVIGKTAGEIEAVQKEARKTQIESRLTAIDADSVRAARAVACAIASGGTPEKADVTKLTELEAEAKTLRGELNTLPTPGVAG